MTSETDLDLESLQLLGNMLLGLDDMRSYAIDL